MRLDKFLVEMSVATRSEAKSLVKKGRVAVNGVTAKASDIKVDEKSDMVTVDGKTIEYNAFEYYMLNKPAGVVTATMDRHDKTVLSLITERTRNDLFPVGRLDKDTEGLLLITNDGDTAHRLLSPKKHVDKLYYAKIQGIVTNEHAAMFKSGLVLADGTQLMPAELVILSADDKSDTSEIELTIHEGKFHQVKRMFEAVGTTVTYLKRISMGPLTLDEGLMPGQYRRLTEEELKLLNDCVNPGQI